MHVRCSDNTTGIRQSTALRSNDLLPSPLVDPFARAVNASTGCLHPPVVVVSVATTVFISIAIAMHLALLFVYQCLAGGAYCPLFFVDQ